MRRRPTRSFAIAVALSAAAALTAPAADAANYTTNGPYGGTVEALAVNPDDPGVVYAGTRQGVFKSVDGGGRWSRSLALLSDPEVYDIVLDPRDANIVFAVTAETIYRSGDAGVTWDVVGRPGGRNIEVAPSDSSRLYVAGDWGITRSLDSGMTWKVVVSWQVAALAVAPRDADLLYASMYRSSDGTNLFRSTDGGRSWELVRANVWPSGLLIDASDPSIVYAAEGSLERTTDAGETWSAFGANREGAMYSLSRSPSDPDTLYASGRRSPGVPYAAVSMDAGANWTSFGALPGIDWLPPVVAPDPSSPLTLYAGLYEFGLYKSLDGGATFSEANVGLTAATPQAVTADPVNPSVLYAAMGGRGVFRSQDGGQSWDDVSSGLEDPAMGVPAYIALEVAVDGAISTVYVSRAFKRSTTLGPIVRSTSDGATWEPASTGLPTGNDVFVYEIEVDEDSPGTAYAPVEDWNDVAAGPKGGLYRTTDGGESWTALGPADVPVSAFVLHDPSDTIYAAIGDAGKLYKRLGSASTWTALPRLGFAVDALAVGPRPEVVYAGGRSHAYVAKSTDGGSTWSQHPIGAGGVHALSVDPLDSSQVYAATHRGIWVSSDAGATWAPLVSRAGVTVDDLEFADAVPESDTSEATGLRAMATTTAVVPLFAAQTGRARSGVWRLVPRPSNVRRPSLSGTPRVGRRLSASTGRWARANRFAYRWFRGRRRILSATSATYRVRAIDRGKLLRCRIRAYGPGGSARMFTRGVRIPAS